MESQLDQEVGTCYNQYSMKKARVLELFAGVGGFRLGLDAASGNKLKYETIWASQFEPSTKKQHAAEVYAARFGSEGLSSENIETVIENNFDSIPNHDLLVGGFPCQDYSVASTLKRSKGLMGKKGVLFWSIYSILRNKGDNAPNYLFLENVDRLLKSPAKQRGRDFAVMLAALSDLDYAVEWRVINAADYGFPQRRRRIFIVGYKKGTKAYNDILGLKEPRDWLMKKGTLADAFPVIEGQPPVNEILLEGPLEMITEEFSDYAPKISPFDNSGLMINRKVYTSRLESSYDGPHATLGDVLLKDKDVPAEFFISEDDLGKWTYLKGGKREERTTSTGHVYYYSEGPMTFPDDTTKPSRTIITGEGGGGASRFKHVIRTKDGRYRRLTPVELERLDMFPDNHTQLEGVSDMRRAFICGNALVVGAITKVGEALAKKM